MSTDEDAAAAVRDVIHRLQSPVPDLHTLLSLLAAPLDALSLLPPQFRRYNIAPLTAINVARHVPPLQRVLLEHVYPTWFDALKEEGLEAILDQYFCPDAFSYASPAAGQLALHAHSSILALPLSPHALRLLERLTGAYPIDRLHAVVFAASGGTRDTAWEDCVRNVVAVPAKAANALAGTQAHPALEHGTYLDNVARRCECLVAVLNPVHVDSVVFLFNKLVRQGVFPSSPPTARSQPSFFQTVLPALRTRALSSCWPAIIAGLSALARQTVLTSLVAALDGAPGSRGLVKREATLLGSVVGMLGEREDELWESVSAVVLNREWSEGRARVFVCWAALGGEGALEILLDKVLDMWSSPEHIKHSLMSRHRYITTLLLLTQSHFTPSSSQITSLALSPALISGVGVYVGHMDGSMRRCGMLAAEVVAQRAGKKLDFGDWEGEGEGKPWARTVRELIRARDVDADVEVFGADVTPLSSEGEEGNKLEPVKVEEVSSRTKTETGYDSDDSLTGYASPGSSRTASPTPSELDEIEKDPTLGVGAKKILRPVYLAQLGELVRGPGGMKADDSQEADRIEMALNCAEELIRKKRGYGLELEENAVNLVYGFVGLQDSFDSEGFNEKRQAALNALVACCPRKAAPATIEEFFKNQYSVAQRYAMLNALALGARELASLPIPQSKSTFTDFPSRMLPEPLHRKYLEAGNQNTDPIQNLVQGITRLAIDKDKDTGDKVPEIVRERRLRITKPSKITEVQGSATSHLHPPPSSSISFTGVAAECFIAPLINRFWLFLRDEQTREARTAHHEALYRYRGAGTGLILNAVVLTHFLRTLAVLVHASQNSPEWLAVMAPDALELAVALGTRPVSQAEGDQDEDGDTARGKEASILTTALELALVVLDGCLTLDGGRSLGLEHTALVLGTGEWAGRVFGQLEKGLRVEGGGGAAEVELQRAAVSVLIKVDELTSKWRRSMIDVR